MMKNSAIQSKARVQTRRGELLPRRIVPAGVIRENPEYGCRKFRIGRAAGDRLGQFRFPAGSGPGGKGTVPDCPAEFTVRAFRIKYRQELQERFPVEGRRAP